MNTCKICGKEFDNSCYEIRDDDRLSDLLADHCFDCAFWAAKIPEKDDPRSIRVNGNHFWIGEENGHKGLGAGHGGSKFIIRRSTGEVVISHNLWAQGTIPERFRDILHDNASFVWEDNKVHQANDGIPF